MFYSDSAICHSPFERFPSMSAKRSLPFRKQIAYAVGQLGWSTLVNIIGLELAYFYLTPSTAGLISRIAAMVLSRWRVNSVALLAPRQLLFTDVPFR